MDNLVDAFHAQVGTTHPMIEIRRKETWLVGHIIMLVGKEGVEALDESLLATTRLYQSWHIMRNAQAVLCRQSLIKESTPPRQIPRSHLGIRAIRYQRMIYLRLAPRHGVEPSTSCITRHDEASHPLPLVITAPKVAPVIGPTEIFLIKIGIMQALRHLGDAPIIITILHGTVASPVDAVRNITQCIVFMDATTSMFFFCHATQVRIFVGWWNLCIFYHSLQG